MYPSVADDIRGLALVHLMKQIKFSAIHAWGASRSMHGLLADACTFVKQTALACRAGIWCKLTQPT